MHQWDCIVSAEPVSACSALATKSKRVDQVKEDVKNFSSPLQGSHTPGGTSIWMETLGTSEQTEPPLKKRAKREPGGDELEEGELIESSEEEKEEEEKDNQEDTPYNKSCDDARSPASDMEVNIDEPGDTVAIRDHCINENITASTDDCKAVTGSAEVSMTQEDVVKVSGPVCVHHCQDKND